MSRSPPFSVKSENKTLSIFQAISKQCAADTNSVLQMTVVGCNMKLAKLLNKVFQNPDQIMSTHTHSNSQKGWIIEILESMCNVFD